MQNARRYRADRCAFSLLRSLEASALCWTCGQEPMLDVITGPRRPTKRWFNVGNRPLCPEKPRRQQLVEKPREWDTAFELLELRARGPLDYRSCALLRWRLQPVACVTNQPDRPASDGTDFQIEPFWFKTLCPLLDVVLY